MKRWQPTWKNALNPKSLFVFFLALGNYPQIHTAGPGSQIDSDHDILLCVATFYSDWALWMKSSAPPDNPREQYLRINKYKDIAQKGLDIVHKVPDSWRNHEEYFIISKCRYCKWENEKALKAIRSAIDLAPSEGDRAQYDQFRTVIEMAQQKFS